EKQDWLFGFFAYDLKNEIERLHSQHIDHLGFPDLYFFQPEIVVGIRQNQLEIHSLTDDPQALRETILQTPESSAPIRTSALPMRARMPKADYLSTVEAIRRHIVEGDLYEMNLCQEFYATEAQIDPFSVFTELNQLSKAPFSAYLRIQDRYLLCASPERFLQKKGQKLLSQPIKGTRKRGATPEIDAQIRRELAESEKDRAENVMIVDLVRNDLAKCCEPGSVKVESLFGIHSFEMVHQMISTVSGQLRPGVHPLDALRGAFPMGSMTGAPKVMAMELIEQYEYSRRGLYSGAVGYFTPGGDFDFNVVIRSILYNETAQYCAIQVGGAIVYDSVPEQEYEECMVKAGAMLRVLNGVLDHDQDFI
ncbi:MAG: aminodeoxychorismate synthase component I, partial [Bacteroidota bacterium]